jgi:hypothetical protein
MKKIPFTRRFAAAAAGAATVAMVGAVVPAAPANAAAVYWTFQNRQTGKCLTAGSTDVVWATSCNGSSSQQWDWIASSYSGWQLLRSRSTGLCLRTDAQTTKNATWQSACDRGATGELFFYYADLQELTTANEYYLAMDSGSSGGVYTTSYFGDGNYAYWYGTHT